MTKRTLIGALAVALALICIGCNSSTNNPTSLEKPIVSAAGSGDGGTLTLSWNAVTDAKSYEITAGDSVYTTTSTSFDVSTPAAAIEVRAVSGSVKSDPDTIDCKVVEGTAEFYGDLDPTHANGFGFDDNGGVVACTLKVPSQSGMDFHADSSHGQMKLVASQQRARGLGDQLKAASGSYDGITMADPVVGYSASLAITADSAYYLRISAVADTWKAADNYAKARVDSVVGAKVSLTTAYQKIPGLRWLVK
jgi:hypothetical protein